MAEINYEMAWNNLKSTILDYAMDPNNVIKFSELLYLMVKGEELAKR